MRRLEEAPLRKHFSTKHDSWQIVSLDPKVHYFIFIIFHYFIILEALFT
jgi:hypothetical protein